MPKVGTRCESLSLIYSGLGRGCFLTLLLVHAILLGLVFAYKEISNPCSFSAATSLTLVIRQSLETLNKVALRLPSSIYFLRPVNPL